MKNIAVVLCGSGFKDGSEIRESVAALWSLSAGHAKAHCFAPDAPQSDVINCLTNEPATGESRNQLVEAARIARGEILPLARFNATKFDGIILPGGFGAAKNLCDFASKGSAGSVRAELQSALLSMHESGKPIGAICIAPAIVALAFKEKKFELTVGEPGEVADEIEMLGHRHVVRAVTECHVDDKNRVVSTPAYMYGQATLHDVFTGIQKLVNEVLRLA